MHKKPKVEYRAKKANGNVNRLRSGKESAKRNTNVLRGKHSHVKTHKGKFRGGRAAGEGWDPYPRGIMTRGIVGDSRYERR